MTIDATGIQQEECAKLMFKAAFDVLEEMKPLSKVNEMETIARKIVQAICAAQEQKRRYIEENKPEGSRSFYIEMASCNVVSSAFMCIINEIDYGEELAPFSENGWLLLSFAQGMLAAKLASDAKSAMANFESEFEYSYDCSMLL